MGILGEKVHPTLGNNAKGQQITLQGHNYPHSLGSASARNLSCCSSQTSQGAQARRKSPQTLV